MNFIANEPATTPAEPANAATVTNDGFFPDIDLDNLRVTMRLDGTVTYERLRDAAVSAIVEVNADLEAWSADQVSAGAATLADVPAKQIGGESVVLTRYRTAVYRLAKADLSERYRGFDATKSGSAAADDQEETVDDHRRAARWAISAILNKPRTTVELI